MGNYETSEHDLLDAFIASVGDWIHESMEAKTLAYKFLLGEFDHYKELMSV